MKSTFTLLLFCCCTCQMLFAQFVYINPVPGSSYHYPETFILLRNGNDIDRSSVTDPQLMVINGSQSGSHTWTAVLCDNKQTVNIKPDPDFEPGEMVTVTVNSKLRTVNGDTIQGTTFSFKIRNAQNEEQLEKFRQARIQTAKTDGEYYDDDNSA